MENKDMSELKANPKNPRIINKVDFENLKRSIKDFGDLSGIVFNTTTQRLVGGHQRIESFRALPDTKRVVITERFEPANHVGTTAVGYVEYNNEQYGYREVAWLEPRELAANIAANRIQGRFDIDMLAQVTYEMQQMDEGLLEATGQTEDEINKLLDMVGANGEGDPADDEAPEVDNVNPPISTLGEIYQLGSHRLMCGDSTDFGTVSDLLNGATIDLIFTDPPYGIDIVGDNGQVGSGNLAVNRIYEKVEGDNSIEVAEKFLAVCSELGIKKSIIWGGNYFTSFLPFSDGWIIWDKRGDMNGNNFADGEMAWCSFHTPVRIYKQVWNGMIREGEKEDRVHPTQKPVKVLGEILQDFSERGNSIYDGFGGSGSILVACETMGRTCYMMELSPAYCDVIRKRYAKHIGQQDWIATTPAIQPGDAGALPAGLITEAENNAPVAQ